MKISHFASKNNPQISTDLDYTKRYFNVSYRNDEQNDSRSGTLREVCCMEICFPLGNDVALGSNNWSPRETLLKRVSNQQKVVFHMVVSGFVI